MFHAKRACIELSMYAGSLESMREALLMAASKPCMDQRNEFNSGQNYNEVMRCSRVVSL